MLNFRLIGVVIVWVIVCMVILGNRVWFRLVCSMVLVRLNIGSRFSCVLVVSVVLIVVISVGLLIVFCSCVVDNWLLLMFLCSSCRCECSSWVMWF